METVGRVESLWRYPVKSMSGEEVSEAFVGFAGFYGDRAYAFRSSEAPKGFPFLTGRERGQMLRYRASYRHRARMTKPPNLAEAEALGPGLTPLYADAADWIVDAETPSGEVVAIDDSRLPNLLRAGEDGPELSLLRSDRSFTDCRPISLISLQAVRELGQRVDLELDKRRFRANIYVDLGRGAAFGEDEWVRRRLRVGGTVELVVLERDPRCKMITLDPETGEANPKIMRSVARDHAGTAGVYAAVLVEGMVHTGDAIALLD